MPKYDLVGVDSNAYSIMGYVQRAMRMEHYSQEEVNNYIKDAKSGDYNHLLATSIDMVDELNSKYKTDEEEYE